MKYEEAKALFEVPEYNEFLEEESGDLRDKFAEIVTLAHRGGKFKMLWDPESDLSTYPAPDMQRRLAAACEALYDSGTKFQTGEDVYLIGSWGPGWLAYGVGCPLMSALTIWFMDESTWRS